MDQSILVSVVQAERRLPEELGGIIQRQRPLLLDVLVQG